MHSSSPVITTSVVIMHMRETLTVLSAALLLSTSGGWCRPAAAQAQGAPFDLSSFPATTQTFAPAQVAPLPGQPITLMPMGGPQPALTPQEFFNQTGANQAGGATAPGLTGNTGNPNSSYNTGEGPSGMGGLTTNPTSQQSIPGMQPSMYGLLAPGSTDGTGSFPSGQWSYGFPGEGGAPYRGVDGGTTGGTLPQTSTASVDLNIVDP
jgi:hypothetical protein